VSICVQARGCNPRVAPVILAASNTEAVTQAVELLGLMA
jgi:hypothetical protein